MPIVDAAVLTHKLAALEAAVAAGKAREAALGQRIGELETLNKRIAGLEADNASLTAEVAEITAEISAAGTVLLTPSAASTSSAAPGSAG